MAFINTIPEITIFIIALSIAISMGSVVTRKQFTDVEQTKKQQKEVSEYNKQLRSAMMKRDKPLEAKLRKKEPQMKQMQAKLARDSLKPTFIFIVPLLLVWTFVLPEIIGPDWFNVPAASSPISMNLIMFETQKVTLESGEVYEHGVPTFFWYLISSISAQGMIMKLMKIT
ncbi:MAG: hypothetical protein CMO19_02065 [Thaumarchaeota archaeon]|nr:hypothetical protein [Nitrososphaerota archaeon]|tara:strand:+ start:1247 stop:1759 length:513 start_codon:yes stop_codon:yes gene_type:complete